MTETVVLDLDKIPQAIPTMTASLAEYLYDAAVYLLHVRGHLPGTDCAIQTLDETLYDASLMWTRQLKSAMELTFGATDYAVEFAAEAIACLTILETTEYTVVERSQRNEGVDFWLAEGWDEDAYNLQRAARMECKGITAARSRSDIKAKVNEAIQQSKQSDATQLPAYIIVAEFGKPVIVMVQR